MTNRGSAAEGCEPRAHLGCQLVVRRVSEAEERPVVLDRGCRIAAFVRDDGEVVVRAGVAWIDGERAPKQIARVGQTTCRFLDQREVHERLDIARVGIERNAELRGGSRR